MYYHVMLHINASRGITGTNNIVSTSNTTDHRTGKAKPFKKLTKYKDTPCFSPNLNSQLTPCIKNCVNYQPFTLPPSQIYQKIWENCKN